MKVFKRILATVLTFAVAFMLLGGIGGALAAAPALKNANVILSDRTAHSLDGYLATSDPAAIWTVPTTFSAGATTYQTNEYLAYDNTNKTITAIKNTPAGATVDIKVAATADAGAEDTATLSVSVRIPSLAFTSDAITLVKGDVLDMASKLTTADPNATDVTWTSVNTAVGSFGTAGMFTAHTAGTTLVRATSTLNTGIWAEKEITVVAPAIALTASAKTITKLNEKSTLTATVSNLNTQVANGTAINWSSDNAAVRVDASATTIAGGVATVTVTGVSNGSATITAKAAGDETVLATIKIGVGTELKLDLTGPNLDKNNRYGTYTVKLLDAAGNVVDNDTSKVHWDWSSSYLTMANDDLNDDRAKMHNGEAHIKMYARANTGSNGTRLYVWLDNESDEKIYHTITITGVSTLPQSGQDFTLVYVLGGLSVALLAAAGVWYGIRKKNSAKA